MKLSELNDAIAEAAPIIGINSKGTIWFSDEATEAEKANAQAIMDNKLSSVDVENKE